MKRFNKNQNLPRVSAVSTTMCDRSLIGIKGLVKKTSTGFDLLFAQRPEELCTSLSIAPYAFQNTFSKSRHRFCHCWVLYEMTCTLRVNMKTHGTPVNSVPLRIKCEAANGLTAYHSRLCTEDTTCVTKETEHHQHKALSTLTAQRDWGVRAHDTLTVYGAASGSRGNPVSVSAAYAVLCRCPKSRAAKAFTDLNLNLQISIQVRSSNAHFHHKLYRNITSEPNFTA